ncbi:hypothetical protein L6452_35377 [Arctium lappa]|uniref:Uncharacterized protein n=1 Tax=Arctium lappa TaxID=4217 RepID=A0ACB8Y7E3_ARCLA|nr:hypothetical protein L6452_35377 [Arctium lappa]
MTGYKFQPGSMTGHKSQPSVTVTPLEKYWARPKQHQCHGSEVGPLSQAHLASEVVGFLPKEFLNTIGFHLPALVVRYKYLKAYRDYRDRWILSRVKASESNKGSDTMNGSV